MRESYQMGRRSCSVRPIGYLRAYATPETQCDPIIESCEAVRCPLRCSVRIFNGSCGLLMAQNYPKMVFLGLKVADSEPIRWKIFMTDPRKSSKIRTVRQKSAQLVENPHDRPRIRTTVFSRYESQMASLRIMKGFGARRPISATTARNGLISRLCVPCTSHHPRVRIPNRWNFAVFVLRKRSKTL